MPPSKPSSSRVTLALSAVLTALALAGCGTGKDDKALSMPESFDSKETHARNFAASEAKTCESARRALLSQGYQLKDESARLVSGSKNFQPDKDVHLELVVRVVCAPDNAAAPGAPAPGTIAFVSALQERYTLKRVNNSASVGVGMLGSLSLPYSSSEDAMVKVSSETVSDERFYARFYALMDRYLVAEGPDPQMPAPTATAPVAAEPKKD